MQKTPVLRCNKNEIPLASSKVPPSILPIAAHARSPAIGKVIRWSQRQRFKTLRVEHPAELQPQKIQLVRITRGRQITGSLTAQTGNSGLSCFGTPQFCSDEKITRSPAHQVAGLRAYPDRRQGAKNVRWTSYQPKCCDHQK
jgi:hypothetical protein